MDKVDESLLSSDSDEFDSMIESDKSWKEKIGLESKVEEELFEKPKKYHFEDGLSDDEEYQVSFQKSESNCISLLIMKNRFLENDSRREE